GCPGSKVMDFSDEKKEVKETGSRISQLRQWPIQLHLVPPNAPYFQGKDVILVADCVGYSLGDFHKDYLKDRSIAIACPKLDSNIDTYVEKLTSMIDDAKINTLTVMTMEVPCCSGLLGIAKKATENASRKIPIKSIVVSVKGEILNEDWV
ncbi:MAG: 4Fe-4S ferredoxin, partial [Thermoplasmatales archaeon]|nr:4Fe-4S ferredoxin [Thermoplasmatales archaeon]